MRLIEHVRAVLAGEPGIEAHELCERLGLPLTSVAPALRAARFWTPEKRAEASRQSKSRARPLSELKADSATHRAIREGVLVRPSICSACGVECKPDGHHHDYSKPLDVIWLCRPCHYSANMMRHVSEPYNAEVCRIITKIKARKGWKPREQ